MQTLTEKRVFGSKHGTTEVFVASETGLLGVTVSADKIGEFGLAIRGETTAVAAGDEGILAGTENGVQYSPAADGESTAQSRDFADVGTDFGDRIVDLTWGPEGPVAVTASQVWVPTDWPLATGAAVDPDVAWEPVGGDEPNEIRAVSGSLVAASDGVYQLTEGSLDHVGLTAVRDIAAHGTPLAATDDGLFSLANGWQQVASGAFRRVGSDGHGHAHAIGDSVIKTTTASADKWVDDELPVDSPAVDVAYGGGVVAAITENGTLCLAAGDGWRQQLLGVRGIAGFAVAPGE